LIERALRQEDSTKGEETVPAELGGIPTISEFSLATPNLLPGLRRLSDLCPFTFLTARLLDTVSVRPPVTTDASFLDYIWQKLGAEARERAREVDRLLERLALEDRPKFLAALFWPSWCRGRNDHSEGKDRYWATK
jgi:hypothetical protein